MQYFSTRGAGPVSLDTCIRDGIASDGGLYLPQTLPRFKIADFDSATDIAAVAGCLLHPFFVGSSLQDEMQTLLQETFSFPIPLTPLAAGDPDVAMLELYHGPTAAFKDIGARFLAAALTRLEGDVSNPLTILVATSGDTGGAVAAAFDQRPGIRVAVLFPKGRVSARQEHQLCCWSGNVLSLEVDGTFDDCQAMVKAALADQGLQAKHRFSSANSINIGRLLPQSTYYADASLKHHRRTGRNAGFIIPTGNLGNALACLMAREMGLPIGPVILATNANRTIADYFESSEWLPRASLQTQANAMDVGDPSNMERLRNLLGDAEELREKVGVTSVSDAEIEAAIKDDFASFGFATCPHTATATHTWRQLAEKSRREQDWILVATAHPAKFETVVEPLVDQKVELPSELAAILSRPAHAISIEPNLAALAMALSDHFD